MRFVMRRNAKTQARYSKTYTESHMDSLLVMDLIICIGIEVQDVIHKNTAKNLRTVFSSHPKPDFLSNPASNP